MYDEAVRSGDKSKKHLPSKLEKLPKKSKKHRSLRKQQQQQSNFQQPLIELITKVDTVQRHQIIPSSSPRKKRRVAGSSSSSSSSSSSRSSSAVSFNEHDFHRLIVHENSCSHHLIDHCDFPQCNTLCPKMRNPFTGDEMDFGMLRDLSTQGEVSRRVPVNRKQRTVLQ